jgi:predicted dinucleotide-binding enzyme
MKIGVLGTGMVGNAIASKLVALGREVMMGSRSQLVNRFQLPLFWSTNIQVVDSKDLKSATHWVSRTAW